MNRTVYTVASGGMASLERLEAVSQNLANANTAGYKAGRVVFEVRPLTRDGEVSGLSLDPILGRTAAQVAEVATVRDFAQGPVRTSGNPLDAALTGEGFFAVATPRGERYTRQGSFALDRDGYLVTHHGERVQGDGGDIRVGGGDIAIGDDGSITADGLAVGRIKVVGFGPTPQLVPEGAALFAPMPGVVGTPIDAASVRMQPGAIEASNVDAVASMVELVEVSRGFESYMRTMQRLDEVAQRSINEVGKV
jgi:flagellar basal-body rod protein FlgG